MWKENKLKICLNRIWEFFFYWRCFSTNISSSWTKIHATSKIYSLRIDVVQYRPICRPADCLKTISYLYLRVSNIISRNRDIFTSYQSVWINLAHLIILTREVFQMITRFWIQTMCIMFQNTVKMQYLGSNKPAAHSLFRIFIDELPS
jgi:hypothetical protein